MNLVKGERITVTRTITGVVAETPHNGAVRLHLDDGSTWMTEYEDTYHTGHCAYSVERHGPAHCPTCERGMAE